jgi:hypothetical protein
MNAIKYLLCFVLIMALVSTGSGAVKGAEDETGQNSSPPSAAPQVSPENKSPAESNNPETSRKDIIAVGMVSYVVPASRAQIIRHQHLREAIILRLQRTGCRVLHLPGILTEDPSFGYVPAIGTFSTPRASAAIHIEFNGILKISFSEPQIQSIAVPDSIEDFWPVAGEAVQRLCPAAKLTWTHHASSDRKRVPKGISSADRLNWDMGTRLARANQLLSLIDQDKQTVASLGELSALFANHAAYFCRTQEESCFRYFGKALLMAELTQSEGADWAAQLRGEVLQLAKRYGAGIAITEIKEPVLPEVVAAQEVEMTGHVRLDTLFHAFLWKETGGDTTAFARGCPEPLELDAGLIAAKPSVDGSDFGGVQFLLDQIVPCLRAYLREVGLAFPSNEAERFNARVKEMISQMGKNPASLISAKGALVAERLGQFEEQGVYGILVASIIENIESTVGKLEDVPDGTAALELNETGPEMRDALVLLLYGLKERFDKMGWGQSEREIEFLFRCYGRAKVHVIKFERMSPVISNDDVRDWNSLRAQFSRAARDPDHLTETQFIWSKLDSPVSSWLAAPPGDSASVPEMVARVVANFNRLLDDRTLFRPEIFTHLPANLVTEDERSRWSDVSVRRLQEINRQLLESAMAPWLARVDYASPPPHRTMASLYAHLADARELCRHGDFGAALQILRPDMKSSAGRDDFTQLYRECLLRTGNLKQLCEYEALLSSFSREDFRFTLLRWLTTDELKDAASFFQEGTHSARDYLSRAEFALRMGNYQEMKAVAARYHYSPSPNQAMFLQVGIILTGTASEQSSWQALEAALLSLLNDWQVDQIEEVVETLDRETKDNRFWNGVKARLQLDDWVCISQAQKVLRGPPDPARLRETVNKLDTLTERLAANAENTKLELYRYAIYLQHDALGQLVLESIRTGMSPEQKLIFDTIRKSHHLQLFQTNQSTQMPDEAAFLGFMVRHGATADNIQAFITNNPAVTEALKIGPPEFREALSIPTFLSFVLHEGVDDSFPELPSRCAYRVLRRKLLCTTATARGFHSYAIRCGLPLVRESGDVSVLLPYLHGEEGRNWILRNAPDAKTGERWLTELDTTGPIDLPKLEIGELVERVPAD